MWSRAKFVIRWGRRQGPQAFGIRRPHGSGVRVDRGVLLGGSGVQKDLPPEQGPCRQLPNFGPAGAPCGVRNRVWGDLRTTLGPNSKTIAFLKETEGFWRSRKVRGGPKIAPKRSLRDRGGVQLVPWKPFDGPWGSRRRPVAFSGTRFWPLSRKDNPKQLLKIVGDKTMLQITIDRLRKLKSTSEIYIITRKELYDAILKTIKHIKSENIIVEPSPKNTAPAIALVAQKIYMKNKNESDEENYK